MDQNLKQPKVSVAIPYYAKMPNAEFLMNRCLESIKRQTFTDYEIVITDTGNMAENTNNAIRASKGEIIKILYMDDYLTEDALERIVEAFKGNWLVTGCMHDSGNGELYNPHLPEWTDDIETGNNRIGSPSVIAVRNGLDIYFDEKMNWLLDVDFYKRMEQKYGEPDYLYEYCTVIGTGDHQTTNIMSSDEKLSEQTYLHEKHTAIQAHF